MRDGLRLGRPNEPFVQNTIFGWIVSGALPSSESSSSLTASIHLGTPNQHCFDLQRFWEIETITSEIPLSPIEQACEEHFVSTHSRRADGRYIIRLPFESSPPVDIGDSRFSALASLLRLEKRLQRDVSKTSAYSEFLSEYEKLGHMIEVSADDSTSGKQIHYIPHHAVLREGSATTRLRVIFNASHQTSNGRSLNDHLLTGPKLHTDLSTIILRWRQCRYVLTADIAKMYRQILVDERDVDYQWILWRSSPSVPVKDYRLLTVTYGTAAAPFLALRVLRQFAIDEGSRYPLVVPVVNAQMYVDDCIFGADSHEVAIQTRDQLISLLQHGDFRLRKWASNHPKLIRDLDESDCGLAQSKDLGDEETLKILGIAWHPLHDAFRYQINASSPSRITKRTILSVTATLFDPLVWITPVTVTAKIMLRRLWLLSCGWDDDLPTDLHSEWMNFHSQLSMLETITIPRWTDNDKKSKIELHGFADTSSKAYTAAVYLRVRSPSGQVTTTLLLGKSRVAPLKTLSIPRLELCAALLLAQVMAHTRESLNLQSTPCYCWSDSAVTLHWLRQSPFKWQTFVANRVTKIQELTHNASWSHVPTDDNPADCASRGLYPCEFLTHPLWRLGPPWLKKESDEWPKSALLELGTENLEEQNSGVTQVVSIPERWDLQDRFSSWSKLLRNNPTQAIDASSDHES